MSYQIKPLGTTAVAGWQHRIARGNSFGAWQDYDPAFEGFDTDPQTEGEIETNVTYWLYARNVSLPPEVEGSDQQQLATAIIVTAEGKVESLSPDAVVCQPSSSGSNPNTLGGLPFVPGNPDAGDHLAVVSVSNAKQAAWVKPDTINDTMRRQSFALAQESGDGLLATVPTGVVGPGNFIEYVTGRMLPSRVMEKGIAEVALGWIGILYDKLSDYGRSLIRGTFSAEGISAFFLEGGRWKEGLMSFERLSEYIATVMSEGVARGFALLKIRPNLQSRIEDGASFDKLALSSLPIAARTDSVAVFVKETGMEVIKGRTRREFAADLLNDIDRGDWADALRDLLSLQPIDGDARPILGVLCRTITTPDTAIGYQILTVTSPVSGTPYPHGMNTTALVATYQSTPSVVVSFPDATHYLLTMPEGVAPAEFTVKLEPKSYNA